MRRKVGQIDIYVSDEDPKKVGSFSTSLNNINTFNDYSLGKAENPNHWIVNLEPKYHGRLTTDLDSDGIRTVLAHELGHVVAGITKEPEHKKLDDKIMAKDASVKYDPQIPREEAAWKLAKEMFPALREDMKKAAIDSYKKGDTIREIRRFLSGLREQ